MLNGGCITTGRDLCEWSTILERCIAESHLSHNVVIHQLRKSLCHIQDRRLAIETMQIKQINPVYIQSLSNFVDLEENPFLGTIQDSL